MKTTKVLLAGILCLGTRGVATADDSSGRYLMRLQGGDPAAVAAAHGLTIVKAVRPPDVYLVSASTTSKSIEAEVQADGRVVGFERSGKASIPEKAGPFTGLSLPASALADHSATSFGGSSAWVGYLGQPALSVIGLGAKNARPAEGIGVVAIIDTGVDASHPTLASIVLPGYDFTRDTEGYASDIADLATATAAILDNSAAALVIDPTTTALPPNPRLLGLTTQTAAILDDDTSRRLDPSLLPPAFGHGTMVAGLVHLVAPGAKILPLKAFGADGSSNTADIVRAIYYAVDHGASVINMSFDMDFSQEVLKAINYATRSGVVCIAAVGNDGKNTMAFPAALSNVIGVAATTLDDARAPFSNFGVDSTDLAAPGVSLVTTYPGGRYAVVSGTSFSAALVSGAASLLVEQSKYGTDFYRGLDAFAHGRFLSADLGYARLYIPDALLAAQKGLR
jgi:hypothetical protein